MYVYIYIHNIYWLLVDIFTNGYWVWGLVMVILLVIGDYCAHTHVYIYIYMYMYIYIYTHIYIYIYIYIIHLLLVFIGSYWFQHDAKIGNAWK